MTLVVALRCADGVVLASDSMRTADQLGSPMTKVFAMAGHGWAVAGEEDLTQNFSLRLRGGIPDGTRLEQQRALQEMLKAAAQDTPGAQGEAIVSWTAESQQVALKILSNGRSTFVEQADFIGNPPARKFAAFGLRSMRFAAPKSLDVARGQIVGYRLIDDVTALGGSVGVGLGVQIATVTGEGARVLDPEELDAVRDSTSLWTEGCSRLLVGEEPPPAESRTPDTGLRPPA